MWHLCFSLLNHLCKNRELNREHGNCKAQLTAYFFDYKVKFHVNHSNSILTATCANGAICFLIQ